MTTKTQPPGNAMPIEVVLPPPRPTPKPAVRRKTPTPADIAERIDRLTALVEGLVQASRLPPPRFVSIANAALRVGVSTDAIRDLIARGTLRGFRPVAGRVVVELAELDKLVLSATNVPATGRGRLGA